MDISIPIQSNNLLQQKGAHMTGHIFDKSAHNFSIFIFLPHIRQEEEI